MSGPPHAAAVSRSGASRASNFADRVLRNRAGREDDLAVYSLWQGKPAERLSWNDLATQVADCRNSLMRLGLSPRDRVVAQTTSGVAALIAFLSVASVGAIWSAVPEDDDLNRFLRHPAVRPRVVLCEDGFVWGGSTVAHDVSETVAICSRSGSDVVLIPAADPDASVAGAVDWGRLFAEPGVLDITPVAPEQGLCERWRPLTSGVPHGELVTHAAAATIALHSLAGAPDVHHDSVVLLPAAVGSAEWIRLLGILSLGVAIVLCEPREVMSMAGAALGTAP